MPTKRVFFLLLISLWVTEPFLSLTTLHTQTHHICQTCGMEDTCGDICCCIDSKTLCGHFSGLYPAGCTPDSARQLFFSQSATKFMPPTQPNLYRADLTRSLVVGHSFCPSPTSEILTPPPQLDHFA